MDTYRPDTGSQTRRGALITIETLIIAGGILALTLLMVAAAKQVAMPDTIPTCAHNWIEVDQ